MEEQHQRCDNCGKQLPSSKMATHLGYCRRNVKKCQACGNMYDVNFSDEHEEQFHRKDKCKHCGKQFSQTECKKHALNCTKKPKFCEYCEQNIPIQEYASHLRICQSRTRICEKCGKDITNVAYLMHVTTCEGPDDEVIEIAPPSNNYKMHIQNQRQSFEVNSNKRVNRLNNKVELPKREQKTTDRIIHKFQQIQRQKEKNKMSIPNSYAKKKPQQTSPDINNNKNKPAFQPYFQNQKYEHPHINNNAPEISYREQFKEDQHVWAADNEEKEIQKAIMMSMGIGQMDTLPNDFVGLDMNASFYRDLQAQDACEQQIKKNKKV